MNDNNDKNAAVLIARITHTVVICVTTVIISVICLNVGVWISNEQALRYQAEKQTLQSEIYHLRLVICSTSIGKDGRTKIHNIYCDVKYEK